MPVIIAFKLYMYPVHTHLTLTIQSTGECILISLVFRGRDLGFDVIQSTATSFL